MEIKKNNSLLPNARKLRREMTPHERKLWYLFLRKYPVKIYKQRIIDNFIVDFYCASAKLVIEIDGSQHYEEAGRQYDEERTAVLEGYGLKVIRFANSEIDRQFQAVCEAIDMLIREAVSVTIEGGATAPKGSPSPPPAAAPLPEGEASLAPPLGELSAKLTERAREQEVII